MSFLKVWWINKYVDDVYMSEWRNSKWMSEYLNEWVNKWMCEYEWMCEYYEWMNEYMNV